MLIAKSSSKRSGNIMKEVNVIENDQELAEVRISNKRYMRRFSILLIVVIIVSLAVRITKNTISYYSNRDPMVRPALEAIPGYYSEEEVMTFISIGIPIQVLFNKFGPPIDSYSCPEGYREHTWMVEPPRNHTYNFVFNGFSVRETNGVVIGRHALHMSSN